MTNDLELFFKPAEFACQCGCGHGFEMMQPDFMRRLTQARRVAGVPFIFSSSYRCPKHNAQVGGVSDSAHTHGCAVDIKCEDGRSRYQILTALFAAGFCRIGIAKTFIHVDSDQSKPQEVIWMY